MAPPGCDPGGFFVSLTFMPRYEVREQLALQGLLLMAWDVI